MKFSSTPSLNAAQIARAMKELEEMHRGFSIPDAILTTTHYLPRGTMFVAKHKGKNYILANGGDIESITSQLPKKEISTVGQLATSLPIMEDEKLVGEILSAWFSAMDNAVLKGSDNP